MLQKKNREQTHAVLCMYGQTIPAGYVEDVVEGQTHQDHRADSLYDARAAETLTMNVVAFMTLSVSRMLSSPTLLRGCA